MLDFQEYIAAEKTRLAKELEAIAAERAVLDARQTTVANEMRAVQAYEATKNGKAASATRRKAATGGTRRGSKRGSILSALQESPMSRGELLEKLGVKNDKSGSMSVSNALNAMLKTDAITRGPDKKYRPAVIRWELPDNVPR